MRRNLNKNVAYFKNLLIHACWVLATCAVVPSAVAEIRGLPDSKAPSAVEVEMGAQEFLKINMEKIRNNYYLVDLQAYADSTRIKYAAAWEKKRSNDVLRPILKLGLKPREFARHDSSLRKQGYVLNRLGSVSFNNELRYFAEWYRTTRDESSLQHVEHDIDRVAFEELNDFYRKTGYELTSLDVAWHLNQPQYAGVWSKGERSSQIVTYDISEGMLKQHLERMQKKEFRLEILRSYSLPSAKPQTFYNAVWKKSSTAPRLVSQFTKVVNLRNSQKNAWFSGRLPVGVSAAATHHGGSRFAIAYANQGVPYKKKMIAEKLIYDFMQDREIVGLGIAITKDERLVYARGFGYADQEQEIIADPTHLFRVASVSKALTGTTVMKMIEMGALSLDDKVFGFDGILGNDFGQTKHPAIKNYYAASIIGEIVEDPLGLVTVRHLLQHTAGGWPHSDGPADPIGIKKELDAAELISWVLSEPKYYLKDKPGMVTDYSNFGYVLLGRIIEKVVSTNQDLFGLGSDSSYEEIVKNLILEPIGINDMHIGETQLADKFENEVVYYPSSDNTKTPYEKPFRRKDASGSWIASPIELARFLVHVDGFSKRPDLLSSNTLKTMITADQVSDNGTGHGMGWKIMAAKKCKSSDPSDPCRWKKDGSFTGTQALIYRYKGGMNFAIVINCTPKDLGDDIQNQLVFLFNDINNFIGDGWPDYDLF